MNDDITTYCGKSPTLPLNKIIIVPALINVHKITCSNMYVFKQTTKTQVVLMINDPNHHHSAHHFEADTEVSIIMLSGHCEGRKDQYELFSSISVIFAAVTFSSFII